MKYRLLIALTVTSLMSSYAFAFEAKFADAKWDGKKVPAGQQCQRFGGENPVTPKFIVSGIPSGADAIVIEYSDRDYTPMDNGGHGMMSFMLSEAVSEVEVPSVSGHTFDLPAGFKMIQEHGAPSWDKAGVYMPPCSGGRENEYYVTIKAVKGDEVLATTALEMGKY